jgi:exodeoxyribonuclease-3
VSEGTFTLATWNVNSIRARGAHVLDWLRARQPDLVGLQELKAEEHDYPGEVYLEEGWESAVHGQKTWNGVALLSRDPLEEVRRGIPELADDPHSRIVSGRYRDLRLFNLYVPNGEAVGSEKYAYKLRWLDALARHFEASVDPAEPVAVFGDFNIAPDDRDLHDPEAHRGKILFSDAEHAALRRLLDWGMVDLFRDFHDGGGHYTWWDYRQAGFRRNAGMRIDLVLVTRALRERAVACEIDTEPRGWEKPSDHAPVIARFREA